jgi:hypothetical protein
MWIVSYLRRISLITGILFIVATAAGVLSLAVFGSYMEGPDYLAKISGHLDQTAVGATLEAVMGLAGAGVAISMYPVLREFDKGIAIACAGLRLAECVIYLVAAVVLLALVSIANGAAAAVNLDTTGFRASADLAKAIFDQCSTMGMLPFGIAAFFYYIAFWQMRLVPRWLSGWGLAAILVTLAIVVLSMATRRNLNDYSALMMPLMLQEMVLAVWLIAKGFAEPALAAEKAARRAAAAAA